MTDTIAKVVVGDWSRDGHNMSDSYSIEIPDNLINNKVNLDEMVASAEAHIGKGTLASYCEGYEESEVPVSFIAGVLQAAKYFNVEILEGEDSFNLDEDGKWVGAGWDGPPTHDLLSEEALNSNDELNVCSVEYFRLWLMLVNIGLKINGNFFNQVTEYRPDGGEPTEFTIGGYGLFCP